MIVERQVAFFLWIIHRALLSKKTNTTPTTTTTTAATTTINLAPHVGTNRRRKRLFKSCGWKWKNTKKLWSQKGANQTDQSLKMDLSGLFLRSCSQFSTIKTVNSSGIPTHIVRVEGDISDHLSTIRATYFCSKTKDKRNKIFLI